MNLSNRFSFFSSFSTSYLPFYFPYSTHVTIIGKRVNIKVWHEEFQKNEETILSDILRTLALWSFSAFISVASHLKCRLLAIIFHNIHMLSILTGGTFASLCSLKPSLFFWCLSMQFFILKCSNSFQFGSHPSKENSKMI